ncbi:S41 family peptidase [Paraflavitalea pollutisoli]|uniref:S41 family peptidase n=1 Tax=Paraflavitalea pollutisoli TaxID=3034143 RepID=UPI0023EA86D8|nr:S41 family peptidase [Paraflavitalea sp. H1-2-19X]
MKLNSLRLLALASLLASCHITCAQPSPLSPDPWNLGFERSAPGNSSFAPWTRTAFQDRHYTITVDSTEVQEGRYALVIRYTPEAANPSEGQVTNTLSIDVPCDTLTLSLYAKCTGPLKEAIVGFNLFQDRGEKKVIQRGFKIAESANWVHYTTKMPLGDLRFPTDHLRISAYYIGKGSLSLDNISILADGKPLYATRSACSPIGETITPLTPAQVTYLALLGKAWGYLKYYHPLVAKGQFNWDGELMRLLPRVKAANNDETFSGELLSWIDGLGPVPPCKKCDAAVPDGLQTMNIDLRWMKDSHFNQALQNKWQELLINRHRETGVYATYDPASNVSVKDMEYNWREAEYPSEAYRLLSLFRYWNIIQYFAPNKHIIGRDWNEVLEAFLPRIAEARDSLAYHTALFAFIHSVRDNHASSYSPVINKAYNHYLPYTFTIINQQLVVKGVYNDSLARAGGLQKGDIIEQIEGQSVQDLVAARKGLTGGSNETGEWHLLNAMNKITGGNTTKINVTIRRAGTAATYQLTRYPFAQLRYQRPLDTVLHKILPGNIGYLNMGLLTVSQVDQIMPLLQDTRAIIFDIRNYPRSTAKHVVEYLLAGEVPFATCTYPSFAYPGAFQSTLPLKCGPSTPNRRGKFLYAGKVIVLVNETTQSHAEWSTMMFQTVPGCHTMGSQTAGSDGNVSRIPIPGGYTAFMTGLGVYYPDSTPTQRVGVKIDQVVKPTLQGVIDGKDEVLEAAIQYAGN